MISIRCMLGIIVSAALSFPAAAQQLTWTSEVQDWTLANIGGGTTQRPTIASTVYNSKIFIAFTASNNCDSNGGCVIDIWGSSGQGSNAGFGFGEWPVLWVPTIGQVYTEVNPAMISRNGTVYIAWTDESGNNWMSISTDGNLQTWSSPLQIPTGSTVESITLIPDPSNSDKFWLGYMSGAGTDANGGQNHYYPTICSVLQNTISFPASSVSCYTTTQVSQANFNPGLIWSGNTLYLSEAYRGSSHCLTSFYSPTGSNPWTYWNPNNLCHAQQTSAVPVPALYNGYTYVAFRSNDSSAAFDLIGGTLSNGTYNWARETTFGQHMDGSPDLLPVSTSQGLSLLYPSELVNFYSRGGNLYSVFGR